MRAGGAGGRKSSGPDSQNHQQNNCETTNLNPCGALSALLTAARLSAEPATSPLEGLWEVLSITNLTTGKVQLKNPEYHMYTATHEMIILTGKDRERIKKSLSDMSAEEVMSQQPMGAGFYKYRVEGGN